jgi:hypothetical protein
MKFALASGIRCTCGLQMYRAMTADAPTGFAVECPNPNCKFYGIQFEEPTVEVRQISPAIETGSNDGSTQ